MLAIQKSKSHKGKCTPNLLPCRVHHNGPVNASPRYWDPETKEGKSTSYFRGRKLHGKILKIPKGYCGLVLAPTDRVLAKAQPQAPDEDVEEEEAEVVPNTKIIEEQAGFEDVMIWGHESLPDEMADPYVRGMEEWISFAETIHGQDEGEGGK